MVYFPNDLGSVPTGWMPERPVVLLFILLVATSLASSPCRAQVESDPAYDDIGPAAEHREAHRAGQICYGATAVSVNEEGQVVGMAILNQNRGLRAILWDVEGAHDLGALPAGSAREMSRAAKINDRGQVVGRSRIAGGEGRAFLWEDGEMKMVPLEGASSIDSRGRVLGTRAQGDSVVAALWEAGEVTDLGTPNRTLVPLAMNDRGLVVGTGPAGDGRSHAFAWEDGELRDLGGLGGRTAWAMDVNESAQIVGFAETATGEVHAVLWKNDELHDLGTFGEEHAVAVAIDRTGRVLVNAGGRVGPALARSTVLLIDGDEVIEVAPPERPARAHDMNDHGMIVGESQGRAVVWSGDSMRELPLPEGCPERPPSEPVVTVPDEDGDGVPNDRDACPSTATTVIVDDTGCASDPDGDQVPDGMDRCPDTPKGTFVGEDGCPIDAGQE